VTKSKRPTYGFIQVGLEIVTLANFVSELGHLETKRPASRQVRPDFGYAHRYSSTAFSEKPVVASRPDWRPRDRDLSEKSGPKFLGN
jgi:hypothetical protein